VAHIYFVGCSAYPACNYAEFPEQKNHHPQKILDEKCPLCGANLAERTNKRGQKFIGCTGYPKCRYARPINVTAEEYEKIKLEKQKEDKNNKGKTSTKGKEKILAIKKKK
jgi:DNA topoisomerase-1